MLLSHSRLVRSATLIAAGLTTALAVGASAIATAAPPLPAPSATVSWTQTAGLVYTGTSASTTTIITLVGTTVTIDDSAPVTAGSGCTLVPGDATKAQCTAFKEVSGAFKKFKVNTLAGIDTVNNKTFVGMIADGGSGNDVLIGGTGSDQLVGSLGHDNLFGNPGVDSLRGDSGNDTLQGGSEKDQLLGGAGSDSLHGGSGDDEFDTGDIGGGADGADFVDGGPGKDHVDYTSYTVPVIVSLNDNADDGAAGEGDHVAATVEDVDGSLGARNILFGSDFDNKLLGGTADDAIFGFRGADFVSGQSGDDTLSGNGLPLTETDPPLADDSADKILGGTDTDVCLESVQDGDLAIGCES